MGCYGIGVGRIIATIIENNLLIEKNKIKGFSLPYNIAPYKVQIIYTEDKEQIAFNIYNQLLENNINTIIDDRKNYSLGNKIKDVYTLGTPYIIIIGNKFDGKTINIENTKIGSTEKIEIEKIQNFFTKL
jgi:prolyl-tRNA synthetase